MHTFQKFYPATNFCFIIFLKAICNLIDHFEPIDRWICRWTIPLTGLALFSAQYSGGTVIYGHPHFQNYLEFSLRKSVHFCIKLFFQLFSLIMKWFCLRKLNNSKVIFHSLWWNAEFFVFLKWGYWCSSALSGCKVKNFVKPFNC